LIASVLLFFTPLVLFSFVVLATLSFLVLDFHRRAELTAARIKVSRALSAQKTIEGTPILITTQISIELDSEQQQQQNIVLDVSDEVPRTVEIVDGPATKKEGSNRNQGMIGLGEKSLLLQYEVIPKLSGMMTFGPVRVRLRDPLGLSFVTFTIKEFSKLIVLPRIYQTPKSLMRSILATSALTKSLRGPLWVRSEEFRELREFVSGDSLRDIAWRASAKNSTSDLFVREVEKDTEVNFVAVLDTSPSTAAGGITQNFLESSVNTIMALFELVSKSTDKFGLLSWGSEDKVFVQPDKGRAQFNKLKEALGQTVVQRGYSKMEEALRFLGNQLKRTSLIIIFSRVPFDEPATLLSTITSLEQRGWRVLLMLPNESGFLPPIENPVQKAVLEIAQQLERERLGHICSTLTEGYRVSLITKKTELLTQAFSKFLEIRRPKMVAS
jgi:uncharacterized protein (DUF58 family)